jgi:hypothetical protein
MAIEALFRLMKRLRFQAGTLSQAPTELITLKEINPVLTQSSLDIFENIPTISPVPAP